MEISFNQRFGIIKNVAKDDVFPQSARNGLMYILEKLVKKGVIQNQKESLAWASIYREMLRTSKASYEVVDPQFLLMNQIDQKLKALSWNEVYVFCERVYKNLIADNRSYDSYHEEWIIDVAREEAESEFDQELNNLLSEENLPFVFGDIQFLVES